MPKTTTSYEARLAQLRSAYELREALREYVGMVEDRLEKARIELQDAEAQVKQLRDECKRLEKEQA